MERVKVSREKAKKAKIIPEEASGKRGADAGESVDEKEVFLKKKAKKAEPLRAVDEVQDHTLTNAELMFLQDKLCVLDGQFVYDMCDNIRDKIDPGSGINFQDEPAVTTDSFNAFKIRIRAKNIMEVEDMRKRSLPKDLDVDVNSDDPDLATLSSAFVDMSAKRRYKYPIACEMVVCNPSFPIHQIIEAMEVLYLAHKPFCFLLPSSFLLIEEFALLFMGKGIVVHHILPVEGEGMAWYFWDGSLKQDIKVRYAFHFAGMQKMDYHTDDLSKVKECGDTIGSTSAMLYETDLELIKKLGESASEDAKELLHLSESRGETNAFDDHASEMSDVNDIGESSSSRV